MSDDAFGTDMAETELGRKATVLMGTNVLKNKRGQLLLTNDRILFTDQRLDPTLAGGVGGALAGAVAEGLQRMRKEKPPLMDVPLTDVTSVAHAKKTTVRDILIIRVGDNEYRFSEGYEALGPSMIRALTERHGRTVTQDGPESWQVSD